MKSKLTMDMIISKLLANEDSFEPEHASKRNGMGCSAVVPR